MSYIIYPLILIVCLSSISCRGGQEQAAVSLNSNSNAASSTRRSETAGGANTAAPSTVTSAHGGNSAAGASTTDKAPLETAELDAKIKKAETKAKAAGASAGDKKAAAEAYLERGNVYYSAGDKRLYRYALGDFRRVLRYAPDNEEARTKIETIVSIYESLGRPVPNNGLEP
ncbi:MAG TPA: tetratricopeptide repeat protein [Pyrinomonadaceae bacterium]|nr:tetratricopeptide repeat protein [Pyrinomonadaceae bacterium]